jgi:hypothetical protein
VIANRLCNCMTEDVRDQVLFLRGS